MPLSMCFPVLDLFVELLYHSRFDLSLPASVAVLCCQLLLYTIGCHSSRRFFVFFFLSFASSVITSLISKECCNF